tara:strand:+ start:22143 stop:23108 length:966 start_codon:yes stop_codon:yes gene_type:complete
MRVRQGYRLPADKERALGRLIRLEWINLWVRGSIVLVLFLTMGSSQAMKASWYEDVLSLLPPIAFLVAMRFRHREPDVEYPYGYQRASVIAFLVSAVSLFLLGGYLLVDSVSKLVMAEHPIIGGITLFGHTVWMGWLMLAALIYGTIPPLILGSYQEKAAIAVHDKTVFSDAKMSKANWLTGLAAIAGILGVGMGWWWADALAGALIAVDVTFDGLKMLREAVGDLMDRRPRFTAKARPSPLGGELESLLRRMPWVAAAQVRLREEGHVFGGEAFVVPSSDDNLTGNIAAAARQLNDYDWRIHEIVIMPVPDLEQSFAPRP